MLRNEPPKTWIKPDQSFNSSSINSENFLIKGDNLEALKLLKNAYEKKIKMIYIDPPYNTGGDGFIYADDRRYSPEELSRLCGMSEQECRKMLEYYSKGKNSHSAWLTFMYPRLSLARNLLRDDGVIFISIDDHEQAQLKILCDEIFGEENFVSCLCVVDNLKGNNNTDGVSQTNEYCLIYAKNREVLKIGELKIQEDDESLQKWNIDDLGYWKEGRNIKGTGENSPREKRPSMFYPIYLNDNMEISLEKNDEFYIKVLPLTNGKEMCWNWSKEFLRNNKHELIVKKTENGFNFIKKQRPILGDFPSRKIKTICYSPKYSTSASCNIIKEIFNNENVFNYSKSVYLIKDFIQISTKSDSRILDEKCGLQGKERESYLEGNDRSDFSPLPHLSLKDESSNLESDIILDFFAGSGTTAQAVMELNAEDNGNRKFILVQLPEPISEKSKSAYDFVKNTLGKEEPKISDITEERIIRASRQIKEKYPHFRGDLGFQVFELEEIPRELREIRDCNFEQIHHLFSNEDLSSVLDIEAILQTFCLYDGIPLNAKREEVDLGGYIAYRFDNRLYLLHQDFQTHHLQELLRKIDEESEFCVSEIVLLAYCFESARRREIAEALNYPNRKSLGLKLLVRG